MSHPLLVRAGQPDTPRYDVVVIGSGMSGLTSAVVLAKEGMRVLVLEQHYRPGGYLHRFYRKGGIAFDVGFHYVGGVEKGQVLGAYLDYCGVRERLHWLPLDPEGYDELRFGERRFLVPAGEERYRERLCEAFPKERAGIRRYFDDLRHICDGFAFYRLSTNQDNGHADKWMSVSLRDHLATITSDPNLAAVLSGQNPLYGVEPRRAPMGLHALVTDSFMQNPYGIDGGGDALAMAMVTRIRELGGEVKVRRRVTSIAVNDARVVTGVTTERGEEFFAPLIISCAHPKITLRLLPEGVLRPGYRRRVLAMEDGPGTISLFVTTRANLDNCGGRNHYLYRHNDIDRIYDNLGRRHEFVFVTVPTAREGRTKTGLHEVIGLGFLDRRRVERWQQTCTGHRGSDYERFKAEQGEDLLGLVQEVLPELSGNVESIEVATPLTNRDYAASEGGAAYGIHHSLEQVGRYGLRPRTRVGGLFLAGQSVLMPGVCGVTISAFHTCSIILGSEYLMRKVHAAA